MNRQLEPLAHRIDFLLFARERNRRSRLTLILTHCYVGAEWYGCRSGEAVSAAQFCHLGQLIDVPLSTRLLIVLDAMARSRICRSPTQLFVVLANDRFVQQHASDLRRSGLLRPKISRSAVKMAVSRIRKSISHALTGAGLATGREDILHSADTGAGIGYRITVPVEWIHRRLD